ncbi:DNA alkylation repair protein [Paeniglutamicibacter cryotolerans]|uniref:3-methyladenine DNA glycosylase AlkD n=1 Tax=Paeniglutamicibacter cryotolerans TaxID=670079 RepID=A0A839QMD1_9MICC|nr:DNA alkylation repair protein [Paeniglutamicibacter cryotolerans]MBB2996920.1 3-methyladenine DNA glycosylase AlkD [Paeniglutamicibacter cryotolerans]
MSSSGFRVALDARLEPVRDPARAESMAAYMKSAMPVLGIPMPVLRKIVIEVAAGQELLTAAARLEAATDLWATSIHREHWYAAQQLTGVAACRGRLEFLPLYERMILEGAWWDVVDGCSRRYGELLDAHPEQLTELMDYWRTDPFLWKRRMSMICQLHRGDRTDTALLERAITSNLGDAEFFIRKAIGWSLRQYARTAPEWVRSFVLSHSEQLSPLSIREALKHLGPLPDA